MTEKQRHLIRYLESCLKIKYDGPDDISSASAFISANLIKAHVAEARKDLERLSATRTEPPVWTMSGRTVLEIDREDAASRYAAQDHPNGTLDFTPRF